MRHIVHKLRQQPIHVRERILILAMAVIAPTFITIWFVTSSFNRIGDSAVTTANNVKDTYNAISNDPQFNEVFPTQPFTSTTNQQQTSDSIGAANALGATTNTDPSASDSDLYPGYGSDNSSNQ